ncbi:hypothetical protein CISG_02631 [Coccidioides immitis RMSCC 3703]|uniref:Uncharacterized protein n=1 Tax=Coccidioides immitis RMSCC 3703 TaxID=454286 RepID=A0A0J8R8A5_COCIT|nr:hypothetical protein CISG_02631 [Coccidioides immitis RMSCC 3703]
MPSLAAYQLTSLAPPSSTTPASIELPYQQHNLSAGAQPRSSTVEFRNLVRAALVVNPNPRPPPLSTIIYPATMFPISQWPSYTNPEHAYKSWEQKYQTTKPIRVKDTLDYEAPAILHLHLNSHPEYAD